MAASKRRSWSFKGSPGWGRWLVEGTGARVANAWPGREVAPLDARRYAFVWEGPPSGHGEVSVHHHRPPVRPHRPPVCGGSTCPWRSRSAPGGGGSGSAALTAVTAWLSSSLYRAPWHGRV